MARSNAKLEETYEKENHPDLASKPVLAVCLTIMAPLPRLLIVTPTLGESPWLVDTIHDVEVLASSVLLQHILVVPVGRVDTLRAKWPRCLVIAEPVGGGVYGALNYGVHASTDWTWITWINDDDRLLPGFGKLWERATHEAGAADIWYGDVDYIDVDGREIAKLPVCRRPVDIPALLAVGLAPFTQQGAIISAALWRKMGGIDASLRIAGDFDFWVRAAATGVRFRYVPQKVAAFRVRSGQLSSSVAHARVEIDAVLRRGDLKITSFRKTLARLCFRAANLSRVIHRVRHTGHLRSQGMFNR